MNTVTTFIIVFGSAGLILIILFVAFIVYRNSMREAKNYERGLKMVPILIHLPPASDDIDGGGRDKRDLTEEVLSQAQVMYNIIASTSTKGFMSRIYGQRHVSFEIVAREGLVYYYAVVPTVLTDTVRQAIAAAYPSARLEEVSEHSVFSKVGKASGTIGGEFTLRKEFIYPISTYMESKRDASRALLNAVSSAGREDGVGIQFLIRPAYEKWTKRSISAAEQIVKNKGEKKSSGSSGLSARDVMQALWKPPEASDKKEFQAEKPLSAVEQAKVDAIQEKIRYPGYEVMIRVVVSSNTAARSQVLLKNIVAAFALFDSPSFNGFKFHLTKNVDELATAFIFRFFPQANSRDILNSVELATLFHLPDQNSIPTSQVKRQMSKQVDGPTEVMETGLLLGYNEFRGVRKPIRLADKDRRRHIHIIGQTGVGKSVLQENLAYQDMLAGRGFALVDPHGDLAEALLAKVPRDRVEDIVYFDPGDMSNPIGLNMFEFDHPDQKDFLVQEAINMLYGLYDPGHTGIVGPRLEHIFRNCALLLMADPAGGTFVDVPKLLVDEQFRNAKLKYVTDRQVLDFWTKEFPASQRSNEAGDLISWVISKFGPFISNDAMRNIIGQTKSGFNFPEIMNNNKILLVNLSKGKMGDLNSKLLGIIFVMKFQAAAMARANIPEHERKDFTLYVDEFQNFATDSFETILSEARKYRLSLVLANQFMTQLKEELREAILGNVGTTITGRIGTTDAEIMVKRYTPVFTAEDLTKLPNFESVCVAQINGTPSAPFSMAWIPPMGEPNQQLSDALKKLSAAKYGRPRDQVERDISARISVQQPSQPAAGAGRSGGTAGGGSSFLDEWLAKRKQMNAKKSQSAAAPSSAQASRPSSPAAQPTRPQTTPASSAQPLRAQPAMPPASSSSQAPRPQPAGTPRTMPNPSMSSPSLAAQPTPPPSPAVQDALDRARHAARPNILGGQQTEARAQSTPPVAPSPAPEPAMLSPEELEREALRRQGTLNTHGDLSGEPQEVSIKLH
ncbi:MAG: TraM recognition domain-containing protein [Candidatus Saccharibacteria bacterium]|nr:TraM recognition domain-containing protein [Candidatus Saccharibacteria bacterium]